MAAQPKKSSKKTKKTSRDSTPKEKNTEQKPRRQLKLQHKQKPKEANVSALTQKKTKTSIKKSIVKLTKSQRLNLQQIEERRQFIIDSIIRGNQQFEEDKQSDWFIEHQGQEEVSSSPMAPYFSESSDYVSEFPGQQKRVSFTEAQPEKHHFTINRLPPKENNPIFDEKKTWISQLMSKKPKKAAIKIMINKRDSPIQNESAVRNSRHSSPKALGNQQNNDTLAQRKYYHEYLCISENIDINYDTLRVFYPENDNLYLVNTTFSYTS